MSASSACVAPARTAETSARSAPSASRTSTKRRNQRFSRAGSASPPAAGRAGSAAACRPSRRRRRRGRGRAPRRARRSSSRGRRFIRQVSMVRPRTQPPPRRATPKSSPTRNASAPLGRLPRARWPPSPAPAGCPARARPAAACAGGSPGRRARRRGRPRSRRPSTSTGNPRRSSANWSKVPPRGEVEAGVVPVAGEDAVADRAAVEREAHVRAAVVDGVHLAALEQQADGVPLDPDDQPALRLELVERGDSDCAGAVSKIAIVEQRRTSTMVQVKWTASYRSETWPGEAASRLRRCASTSAAA